MASACSFDPGPPARFEGERDIRGRDAGDAPDGGPRVAPDAQTADAGPRLPPVTPDGGFASPLDAGIITDAGAPPDGGAPADAGERPDAAYDAGMDGGVDAGPIADAGIDAGVELDAGIAVDAGGVAPAVDCGNAAIDDQEECDDGNQRDGDGCDAACQVEAGSTCFGRPSICAPQAAIAYVDAAEDCPGTGASDTPYCSIDVAVFSGRTHVFVRPGRYRGFQLPDRRLRLVAHRDATILDPVLVGPNGQLSMSGFVLEGGVSAVGPQSELELSYNELRNAPRVGVHAEGIAAATLEGNTVQSNDGGGIHLDQVAAVRVRNNLILKNGSDRSAVGGLRLDEAPDRAEVRLNTIIDNQSARHGGLSCTGRPASVDHSILFNNQSAERSPATSLCIVAYSIGDDPQLAGTTNITADPDLDRGHRPKRGSPCIDAGHPGLGTATDLVFDVELGPRVLGAAVDLGALERE